MFELLTNIEYNFFLVLHLCFSYIVAVLQKYQFFPVLSTQITQCHDVLT